MQTIISKIVEEHRRDVMNRAANRRLAVVAATPHGERRRGAVIALRTRVPDPLPRMLRLLVVVSLTAGASLAFGVPAVAVTHAPAATATAATAQQPVLRQGDRGAAVARLQRRLVELRYWLGAVDGSFGPSTAQAVMAFQKVNRVHPDTVVRQSTWNALAMPVRPKARSRSGVVIEIERGTQVLLRVKDGTVRRIFNTSTGKAGMVTPRGRYTVFRHIDGWRNAPLGSLYRPQYFNGGIAIHGARDIPSYPASHGCARVSLRAMDWLFPRISIGTPVWVY